LRSVEPKKPLPARSPPVERRPAVRKRESEAFESARLADYLERQTQKHLLPTIAHARGMAERSVSPPQRAQILTMIAILEEVVRLFRSPVSHRLVPWLERAHQRVHGALIALSTYDDDDTALKFWADEILHSQESWPYLADVATLDHSIVARPVRDGVHQIGTKPARLDAT